MAISPSQILIHVGGNALKLHGTASRRVAPIARRGEDVIETFTRAAPPASYRDAGGEVKLAEIDALRVNMLDLDVAGVFDLPAIGLEDTRTNGFTRSEELDNAAWTKTRATVTINATTAPDGKTTADKLVEDGTAADTHLFSRLTPALTDNTLQSFGLFAKAAGRSEIQVEIGQKDGTTASVWFNLDTGVIGTATGGAVGFIDKHADGWYRCSISADSASGATPPRIDVRMGSGGETNTYNGDSTSGVHFWGMQFEVDKSFPSSYIATLGSTVTRAVDDLTFPFDAAPQQITVYCRHREGGTVLDVLNTRLFQFGESVAPFLHISASGSFYRAVSDNNVDAALAVTLAVAPSIGDLNELVLQVNSNGSFKLIQSINGATTTETVTSAALAFATAWSSQTIRLNARTATSNVGYNNFVDLFVARGTHSPADCRLATQQ